MLPEADVVMLIGARLNWLLSHGKGKTWGGKSSKDWGGQKFIQIDISPQEADSNVRIDAPVVGDIGSCVSALLDGHRLRAGRSRRRTGSTPSPSARTRTSRRWRETLAKNPSPMNFHSALNVVRDIVKANPDAILVNEGANALDFTRSIVDMYKPRKRLDVGTWGVMGIGMGFAVAAAVVTGKQVIAIEGDSAFGFSGMEVETICRYNLPVCVVDLEQQRRLPRRRSQSDRRRRSVAAGVRQGRALRQDDGGVRRRRRARDDAGRAAHGPWKRRWTPASRRSSTR